VLELELCTAAPRAGSANQAWITVRSAPPKVDVVPDHHLGQFGEANLSLPAENAARLGRIAAQRIDVSSRPLVTTIYFDVLPVKSSRRESELREIASAIRLSVAFSCRGHSATLTAPTVMLICEADDTNPAEACREMAAQPHYDAPGSV
jgi:hypothetical protein